MIQILERPASQGERFMQSFKESAPALGQAFNAAMQPGREKRENEALQRLTGKDFSGVSADLKKEMVKNLMTGQGGKGNEKMQQIQTGLGTIGEMRKLLSSAGPSNMIQGFFPGETQKNRAKLAQMGRSLIPLVSAGVSIRNQKEFEEYSKTLTNPNARQSELEGALEGLENILQRESGMMGQQEMLPQEFEPQQRSPQKAIQNMVKMQAPDGTVRLVPKEQAKAAMDAGGKVLR